MGNMFDFGGIQKCEETLKRTWIEFRDALAKRTFSYDEIDKARKITFLRVYDDLFVNNLGIELCTLKLNGLNGILVGRGCILQKDEVPNYERFIPKKEYIKNDNRFSPKGIEWLYLTIGNEEDIHVCAHAECRAQHGDRFGFCHFQFDRAQGDIKLVDLTIARNVTYEQLNQKLESYGQLQVKKEIQRSIIRGSISKCNVDVTEFKRIFTEWSIYTYTKLLSDQIFVPIEDTNDKCIMYAPFHTMAQYYISLGYSGILYGSTVSDVGRNIVLFNKNIAKPNGNIEVYTYNGISG